MIEFFSIYGLYIAFSLIIISIISQFFVDKSKVKERVLEVFLNISALLIAVVFAVSQAEYDRKKERELEAVQLIDAAVYSIANSLESISTLIEQRYTISNQGSIITLPLLAEKASLNAILINQFGVERLDNVLFNLNKMKWAANEIKSLDKGLDNSGNHIKDSNVLDFKRCLYEEYSNEFSKAGISLYKAFCEHRRQYSFNLPSYVTEGIKIMSKNPSSELPTFVAKGCNMTFQSTPAKDTSIRRLYSCRQKK